MCHLSYNKTWERCVLIVTSVIQHFQMFTREKEGKSVTSVTTKPGCGAETLATTIQASVRERGEGAKKQPRCRRERNDTFDVSRIQHQRP